MFDFLAPFEKLTQALNARDFSFPLTSAPPRVDFRFASGAPTKAPRSKTESRRAAEDRAARRIIEGAVDALAKVRECEERRTGKGGWIDRSDLAVMRAQGVYVSLNGVDDDDGDDAFDQLGAFVPGNNEATAVDVTYGLPKLVISLMRYGDGRRNGAGELLQDRELVKLQRLQSLPFDAIATGEGYAYRLTRTIGWRAEQSTFEWYFTISRSGVVSPTLRPQSAPQLIKRARGGWTSVPAHGWKRYERMPIGDRGSETLAAFVDQVVALWRAQFFMPILKLSDSAGRSVRVSVPHSLMPAMLRQRETDERRGIHWVAAHRRKNGATVRTHMRGATRLTFAGHDASLMVPGDGARARSDAQRIKLTDADNAIQWDAMEINVTSNKLLASLLGRSSRVEYVPRARLAEADREERNAPIDLSAIRTVDHIPPVVYVRAPQGVQ